MKNILIVGAGGHGMAVKEIIEALGEYSRIDFLDDNSEIAIGKISEMNKFKNEYDYLFCSIGNNRFRKDVLENAEKCGYVIPIIIHPSAYVAKSAKLGNGALVAPNAVVNSNSTVGKGCIISAGAVIDHDVSIENYVHINAGVVLYSSCKIDAFTKISCDNKLYKKEIF